MLPARTGYPSELRLLGQKEQVPTQDQHARCSVAIARCHQARDPGALGIVAADQASDGFHVLAIRLRR